MNSRQQPVKGQQQQQEEKGGARPAHEVRLGRIKAAVWENHSADQGVWYSVTVTRSYKDAAGQWKSAASFGKDDLLVVAEACRLAYLWVAGRPTTGANREKEDNG